MPLLARFFLLLLIVFAAAPGEPRATAAASAGRSSQRGTFSIAAFDPATGDLGVAVASKFPAVGALVPWGRAGVGAVATQAAANLTFGERGLELLAQGMSAEEAVAKLVEGDAGREERQLGLVDAKGRAAAWTGKNCFDFAGHIIGKNYTVQGNILAGRKVIEAMAQAYEKAGGTLGERLLAALEAGERAGGDRRGKQSAALLVLRKDAGYGGVGDRWIDLRVDDHSEPVQELRRLLEVHTLYFGETRERVQLTARIVRQVQSVLKCRGFYKGDVNGTYDDATRKALEDYQGWENLEMRFRRDDQIDRVVLNFLRRDPKCGHKASQSAP